METKRFDATVRKARLIFVLTDLQHKGMNGVELMLSIHKKNRKQHVRLVTGWPILQKPFMRDRS
jgi:hypothetical protein